MMNCKVFLSMGFVLGFGIIGSLNISANDQPGQPGGVLGWFGNTVNSVRNAPTVGYNKTSAALKKLQTSLSPCESWVNSQINIINNFEWTHDFSINLRNVINIATIKLALSQAHNGASTDSVLFPNQCVSLITRQYVGHFDLDHAILMVVKRSTEIYLNSTNLKNLKEYEETVQVLKIQATKTKAQDAASSIAKFLVGSQGEPSTVHDGLNNVPVATSGPTNTPTAAPQSTQGSNLFNPLPQNQPTAAPSTINSTPVGAFQTQNTSTAAVVNTKPITAVPTVANSAGASQTQNTVVKPKSTTASAF